MSIRSRRNSRIAKFIAYISLKEHVEIDADDIDGDKAEAESLAQERSVYNDNFVYEITEKFYQD